jgi:hypothetical protein
LNAARIGAGTLAGAATGWDALAAVGGWATPTAGTANANAKVNAGTPENFMDGLLLARL